MCRICFHVNSPKNATCWKQLASLQQTFQIWRYTEWFLNMKGTNFVDIHHINLHCFMAMTDYMLPAAHNWYWAETEFTTLFQFGSKCLDDPVQLLAWSCPNQLSLIYLRMGFSTWSFQVWYKSRLVIPVICDMFTDVWLNPCHWLTLLPYLLITLMSLSCDAMYSLKELTPITKIWAPRLQFL
jgi:hypothetical protein